MQTLNKNEQVDPEVESLEDDGEPEVIVDKIGLMHEIPNGLLDMYLLTQKNHPKSMMFLKATKCSHVTFVGNY